MGPPILQASSEVWALVRRQHGVVTRKQLLGLGYGRDAIRHRLATGRLHRVLPGVYAVGRPALTQHGRWMAAVLACGPDAVLSHSGAAALWRIRPALGAAEVSVPGHVARRPPRVVVHRRIGFSADDVTCHQGIPVTTPVRTLADIATQLPPAELEAAVNEADKLDIADAESLRAALDTMTRQPGVAGLRRLLDRRTFTLTDSALERRFLQLVRAAGLPLPQTGAEVNGFKVDFFWPELALVVETDGLRYHRTPAQQTRDRLRDQVHTTAGLTPLRFTRAQVAFEPHHVHATLTAVTRRLRSASV